MNFENKFIAFGPLEFTLDKIMNDDFLKDKIGENIIMFIDYKAILGGEDDEVSNFD